MPLASFPPGLDRFCGLQPILVCPVTGEPLTLISRERLLELIPASARETLPPETAGAFIANGGGRAYLIQERIVDLLADHAMPLAATEHARNVDAPADAGIKSSVQRWYDDFGWRRNAQGVLHDTACFSLSAPTPFKRYEQLSHLSLLSRLGGGEFILDAASGAVPHPEYLSYSWFHRYRVCVDFSRAALREAEARVGDVGFYCLADITRLPFRDDAFDGIVSAYTLMHVPESQQETAVRELYRVLSPSCHLCLLVGVETGFGHRLLINIVRLIKFLLRLLGRLPQPAATRDSAATEERPPHALYYKLRPWSWWRQFGRSLTLQARVESLRMFHKDEFEYHFTAFGASGRVVQLIRGLELLFPCWTARISTYILVDLFKRAR